MPVQRYIVPAALLALLALRPSASGGSDTKEAVEKASEQEVRVPPRKAALENFPCQKCHAMIDEKNAGPPRARVHAGMKFRHMPAIEKCGLCHLNEDMDMLGLFDGRAVSFDASQKLCGQCHGEVLKDWKINLHGKQVGSWMGITHRYACVECHDPHAPARSKMTAEPPPPRPRLSIPKKANH